jgi:hypothetical protein
MNKYEENAFNEMVQELTRHPDRKTMLDVSSDTNLIVLSMTNIIKTLNNFTDKIKSQESQ